MIKFLMMILVMAGVGFGTTYNPATCEFVPCSTAVATAASGDTVRIPAGSETWAYKITWVNKNLVIIGAGMSAGGTWITTTGAGLFGATINDSAYAHFVIRGFSVIADRSDQEFIISVGSRNVNHPCYGPWEIDSVRFNARQAQTHAGVYITGINYGVIHNFIVDTSMGFVTTNPYLEVEASTGMYGDTAWKYPLELGSAHAVYIEDGVFNFIGTQSSGFVVDAAMGGRYVVRHCTITGSYVQTHSMRGDHRGAISFEVYDNTFIGNGGVRPSHIRSGTGVIFNNTVSGYTANLFYIDNQRTCTALTTQCDGTASIDGNFEGEYGWPCLDQIGRAAPGYNGGTQGSEPLYGWNNGDCIIHVNGDVDTCLLRLPSFNTHLKTTGDASPHAGGILDYVNNGTTPKPGYVAYQYPFFGSSAGPHRRIHVSIGVTR